MELHGFADCTAVRTARGAPVYRARSLADDTLVMVTAAAPSPAEPPDAAQIAARADALRGLPRTTGLAPVLAGGLAEDGTAYLVTPWYEGGTLGERLRGGWSPPARDTLALGAAIAAGLEALHAAGLAHGGLDVDSIVFAPEGTPIVTGFAPVAGAPADDRASLASLVAAMLPQGVGAVPASVVAALQRAGAADPAAGAGTVGELGTALSAGWYEMSPPMGATPSAAAAPAAEPTGALPPHARMPRRRKAWIAVAATFALGVPAALGLGVWGVMRQLPQALNDAGASALDDLAGGGDGLGGMGQMMGFDPPKTIGAYETGSTPVSVAASPDGKRVYSLNCGDGTLSTFEVGKFGTPLATTVLAGETEVRRSPSTCATDAHTNALVVAPDSARVYAVDTAAAALLIVGPDGEPMGRRPLGGEPVAVAVSPDGSRVYVANAGTDVVSILDADGTKVTDVKVAADPHALAVSKNGQEVLVAHANPKGTLTFLTGAGKVIDTDDTGAPLHVVSTNATAGDVVVAGQDMSHYAADTWVDWWTGSFGADELVGLASLPEGVTFATDAQDPSTLWRFDADDSEVDYFDFGVEVAPLGLAVSADGGTLYVAASQLDTIEAYTIK